MLSWELMAERRMRKAELDGSLRGLSGEGEPLAQRNEEAFIDPGTAIGFRIMAEAGALPREVELRKHIARLKETLAAEEMAARRKTLMGELAQFETRLAMEQEARRRFFR